MNPTQIEKVKQFANDNAMSEAVYYVLLKSFLRRKERTDVNITAAERIAIDLLEDGWKEIQKHKNTSPAKKKELEQVGL